VSVSRPSLILSAVVGLSTCAAAGLVGANAHAGATASSFKKESKLGANYWNAQAALDTNGDTCWMLPGESTNRGEWIMIDVPKSGIDKLGLVIGWAKSEEDFKDYARIKEVKVEVFSFDENQDLKPLAAHNLKFEDKMEMQVQDLPDVAIDDMFGGKVKITVVDVYDGKDFPNLAVSEVLLHLKDFDAGATMKSASEELTPMDNLIDDNPKTAWTAPAAGASFTFEAAGFAVSKIGLTPMGKDYARAKKVEITANDRSVVVAVPDATSTQWISVPSTTGYTGGAWGTIQVKFLEVYPGAKHAATVGVAELDLKATAYEGI
jgi:hypothetical protein